LLVDSEAMGYVEDKRAYPVRRSQLEIQMDILRVVYEGASLPTQIMYRANLAWDNLQNSLRDMVGNGLLERIMAGEKRTYQLTFKGADMLAAFDRIIRALQNPMLKQRYR